MKKLSFLLIFLMFCLTVMSQPISLSEFKSRVNDSIRNASGSRSITPDIMSNRYDELADIISLKADSAEVVFDATGIRDTASNLYDTADVHNTLIQSLTTLLNQIAPTYVKQGGNAFNDTLEIGTTDSKPTAITRNGTVGLFIDSNVVRLSDVKIPQWDRRVFKSVFAWEKSALRSRSDGGWGISSNAVFDSSGNWVRIADGPAYDLVYETGIFQIKTAVTGLAGSTIGWRSAMKWDEKGFISMFGSTLPSNIRTIPVLYYGDVNIQFIGGGAIAINSNCYQAENYLWYRIGSGSASNVTLVNGDIIHRNIGSGTAGTSFNWIQGQTFKSNGVALFGGTTDRATGNVQLTGNISVLGSNSSNTYRWDAASSGAPSNTATPAGWVLINVNGSTAYVPYYQ